jgi:adenylosuccinate lyase
MEAVKHGANRQEMHEVLRTISMIAWQKTQEGKPNPMEKLLITNPSIKKYLKKVEIKKLLDVKCHIGNAPKRALKLVEKIKLICHCDL